MAPQNQNTPLGDRLLQQALTDLIRELRTNNQHLSQQDQKASREKIQTDLESKQRAIYDQKAVPYTAAVGPFRDVFRPRGTPPDSPSFQDDLTQARDELPRSFRQRMGQYLRPKNLGDTLRGHAPPLTQQAGEVSPSASRPEQVGGTGQTGVLGNIGVDPHHAAVAGDPTAVLTTALLGEHGGPAFIRNAQMESFALKRNLNWAQTHINNAFNPDTGGFADSKMGNILNSIPGVTPDRLTAVRGGLDLAMRHPLVAYGAYRAVTGIGHGIGTIGANMRDWQDQGAQFGLNANNGAGFGAANGQYRFGFHNPLSLTSDATQVGAGFEVERQRLMGRLSNTPMGLNIGGGEGLSKEQAGQTVQELAGQGFGGDETTSGSGTNTQIAENLVSPLLQHIRGLRPADVTQFDPVLRNGGTSIQQLSDSIRNLDSAALATHETVGQMAGSLANLQSALHGMGSQQGALDIGRGFTAATGMDPQIAGQLAQSPLMQGMMLSKGILPSGMADANAGTFSSTAQATIQMLQHATQGFKQDKYTTINGRQVLSMSGNQAQIDQMAQMSGLDPNVIKRYMADPGGDQARNTLTTALGSSNSSTGIYQLLNNHVGQKAEEQYWNQTIMPNWKNTGISEAEMRRLGGVHDIHKRAEELYGDLNHANAKSPLSQVATNPNAQTVNVKFTGAAAKLFQVDNNSTPSKSAANAAQGPAMNSVVNSPLGDPYNTGALRNAAAALVRGH